MTEKEKAIELVNKYKFIWKDSELVVAMSTNIAKQCALIAVDEIIKELYEWGEVWMKRRIEYWQEVKQEIEKL